MFLRDPIVKEMAEIIIARCPKDEDGDFEEGFLNYPCKWDTVNIFNKTTVSIGFNDGDPDSDDSGEFHCVELCAVRGVALLNSDKAEDLFNHLVHEFLCTPEIFGDGDQSYIMYGSVFEVAQAARNLKMAQNYTVEKLDDHLSNIWSKGDQDEQSTKHIYYAIGAMLNGHQWSCGLDYPKPDGDMTEQDWTFTKNTWFYVQAACESMGTDKFKLLLKQTKNFRNFDYYVEVFAQSEKGAHSEH